MDLQDTLNGLTKSNIAACTTHALSLDNSSIFCHHLKCVGQDVCKYFLTRAQLDIFQRAFEDQIQSYFTPTQNTHSARGILLLNKLYGHATLQVAAAQANICYGTILKKLPPFILFGIDRTRVTVTFEAGCEPVIISDLRRPILWKASYKFDRCENHRVTNVSECFEAEIINSKDPELVSLYLSFHNCKADSKFFEQLARSLMEPLAAEEEGEDVVGRQDVHDQFVPIHTVPREFINIEEEIRKYQDVMDLL